jgi:periplasmic divalent cation tolerance protein
VLASVERFFTRSWQNSAFRSRVQLPNFKMNVQKTNAVVVLTTLGESTDAAAFARVLVADRLAACVNVLPPMTSLYRWKSAIEEDREQQLVIKTTRDRVPAIEARFHELHPYELPEFVVLSAEASTAYLNWLVESVGET